MLGAPLAVPAGVAAPPAVTSVWTEAWEEERELKRVQVRIAKEEKEEEKRRKKAKAELERVRSAALKAAKVRDPCALSRANEVLFSRPASELLFLGLPGAQSNEVRRSALS